MKFRNLFVCGLVLLFVALAFVAALEVKKSEILIRTKPYQNLTLKFVDVEGENVLQVYSNRSRKFGELRWTFYTVVGGFKLFITDLDTDGAEPIEYGPFQIGSPVEVNFSGRSTENANAASASSNNSISLTNSSVQGLGNSPLTGLVVDGEGTSSNVSYFIAIGTFALAMAALVIRRTLRNRMTAPASPNPNKFDKPEKTGFIKKIKTAVAPQPTAAFDAEKKIAELQKQLNELKNEERIVDLQRQIAKERNLLRRMQSDLDK